MHGIRRNITLGGYLDTRRNIENIYGTMYGPKKYIAKILAIVQTSFAHNNTRAPEHTKCTIQSVYGFVVSKRLQRKKCITKYANRSE